MGPKALPTPKKGERNIYCPFYSDCLDHAIKHFWRYWSCPQCPYRKITSFYEVEYSANSELIDYEFSPDIVRKFGGNDTF
ncbi:MAG: hypothetical protein ACQEQO_11885 [Thermodesulfobacteriota bacterium]